MMSPPERAVLASVFVLAVWAISRDIGPPRQPSRPSGRTGGDATQAREALLGAVSVHAIVASTVQVHPPQDIVAAVMPASMPALPAAPPAHPSVSRSRTPGAAAADVAAWPASCPAETVPVVFPNSSADRTEHMLGLMSRIGGCSKIVPAVMRDRVAAAEVAGHTEARYEGTTIFNSSVCRGNKFPVAIGRLPNAATHARMYAAATATAGVGAGWAMMMEDDAQLHADLRASLPLPADVARMLAWSFAAAEALELNMISYGVCQGKRSLCKPIPESSPLQQQYPDIQLATCGGDFRCAATYAIPGSRAGVVRSAYGTLNSGSTACPAKLISSASCGRDPYALVSYLGQCADEAGGVPACISLVVGYNLVSPTAHPVKKDHRGAFIQEKTKDFIKHYAIAKALPGS